MRNLAKLVIFMGWFDYLEKLMSCLNEMKIWDKESKLKKIFKGAYKCFLFLLSICNPCTKMSWDHGVVKLKYKRNYNLLPYLAEI